MLAWIRKWFAVIRAWRQGNERAHARAQSQGCCSSPPPGAGDPQQPRRP